MEIEFQGQYDKASIFKAVSLANKPSRRNKLIRIGLTVLFLAIYAAYFINLTGKENLSSLDFLKSGRHLITLLIVAYFLLQPYISSFFTAAGLWKNPAMQKPLAGVISSQCITYINATKEREEIAWENFAKKQMTKDLIVLLTADGVLLFFPRHFFKTDNDWQRVKQWVDFKVVEAI